tara:strand:+ start:2719 stop:3579 length:861 start_codon:yes stop_codon:yes gene_type:complete
MLNKNLIKKFNDQGYIIIKNLVGKREIKKIYSQMNTTLNTILDYNKIKFSKNLSLDKKYFLLKRKIPVLKSHFYDSIRIMDALNNVIYSPKIVSKIKKLLNTKTVFITNHRLRTDSKIEKANLAMHQELNNISTESALVFCPFVEVSKKIGGLCVIPKSHIHGHIEYNNTKVPAEKRDNGFINKILKGKDKKNYKNEIIKNLFDKDKLVFPHLYPGDAVIFKSMLFHGSTNYKKNGLRWTLIANYHKVNKTPYILKKDFKPDKIYKTELGMPMRIPYNVNYNKIFK